MKDQTWFDSEELFLSKIEKQCNIYQKHYSKEYTYYSGLSSKFNIPILITSAVNALTAIALNNFVKQELVSIMNAVLSAGTGVLGSIQLYMKLNEKMTNALRSSISMKKLALKISKELTVDRQLRVTEGMTFLQECFSDFNTSIEAGNPIEIKIPNHLAFPDDVLISRSTDIVGTTVSNDMMQNASRLQGILAKISLGSRQSPRTDSNSPSPSSPYPDSPQVSGGSSRQEEV
jgi:hypothetical protein